MVGFCRQYLPSGQVPGKRPGPWMAGYRWREIHGYREPTALAEGQCNQEAMRVGWPPVERNGLAAAG